MKKISIFALILAMPLLALGSPKVNSTPISRSILPPERAEANWVDINDECLIVDDITTGFFDFDQGILSYEVAMQADENNPGMYRLVNPWQYWPMLKIAEKMGGAITVSDDFYIEIDATDPDAVKIFPQDSGLDDGDGNSIISSLYGIYDELNISEIQALAMSGVLEDNVISFTAPASIVLIQDGQGYRTNQEGRFAIILPGGELPIDYAFEVEQTEKIMADVNGYYHYYIDAEDDRIPEIRWGVTTDYPKSEIFDEIALNGNLCEIGDDVEISVNDLDARMAYVVFVSVDEYGDYQETEFFEVYPPTTYESWASIGSAVLTEDFLASFMKDIDSETVDVEVEQHKVVDNYYRFKLPMEKFTYADKFEIRPEYQPYIYINLTNPERPYVAQSCLGLIRDGNEYAISSHYCQRVAMMGLKMAELSKVTSGGVWKDNVLTFDPEPGIFLQESTSSSWWYVNVTTNPDFDYSVSIKDSGYDVPRFLPGKFKLDMNRALSGLESLTVENSDQVKYYNLQGMAVEKPTNGIYIVRTGNKVSKEYIK